jgi:hypothetical protein
MQRRERHERDRRRAVRIGDDSAAALHVRKLRSEGFKTKWMRKRRGEIILRFIHTLAVFHYNNNDQVRNVDAAKEVTLRSQKFLYCLQNIEVHCWK